MKKVSFFIGLVTLLCTAFTAPAQVTVSINISSQPVWGPVGYDYVEYYYIPDAEVYYYVPTHQFFYFNNKRWVTVYSLPSRYSSINLYTVHKVVVNEPKPYLHHDIYKVKYASFKGKKGQAIIRDSHDEKYFIVKGHPEHAKYKAAKSKGNGAPAKTQPSQYKSKTNAPQKVNPGNGGGPAKGNGGGQRKGGGGGKAGHGGGHGGKK